MDRGRLALHKDVSRVQVWSIIIIVAVAGPFLAGGAQFIKWNPSKKAAIVVVYDRFQALWVHSKLQQHCGSPWRSFQGHSYKNFLLHHTVSAQNFSIKNGSGTCSYQLQTVLTWKPIDSFSKYAKVGLLAASRFCRTQFWSDMIVYLEAILIYLWDLFSLYLVV